MILSASNIYCGGERLAGMLRTTFAGSKVSSGASSGLIKRRLPIGAEVLPSGGVHFRVWAPRCERLEVVLESDGSSPSTELAKEQDGYFAGRLAAACAGELYRFRLDGGEALFPDPASRFQPDGPLGPSMVIDPNLFRWSDAKWPGVHIEGQVIYEMHIGTFTAAGTWKAASEELQELKALGITVLEIMPVHDFCGRWGWGYDGVDFFAPTRLYGRPDDFRAFVDQAHAVGLGVILDVVYNHAGPAGNYLREFSADYFTDRYSTDWGEAFNFDGRNSGPVREFFTTNAGYWIEEFHLDGLRLDATQNIYDASEIHILADIVERVRRAAAGRSTIVIAENEEQNTKLIRSSKSGGYGIDGLWNDDFHHSAIAILTGHNEAYLSDYRGKAQEFVSAAKWGFLYQGQHYRWQLQRRGTPAYGFNPCSFISYLENHDQVANIGCGKRAHQLSHPGSYRAVTALLILCPQTPLLFQGQEFAATSPFVFFADHDPDLAAKVKEGRFTFLSQFPSLASEQMRTRLPDPTDPKVFQACHLDFSERTRHREAYTLHRDLLKLRREDVVINAQRRVEGATLDADVFVLRFFGADGNDRLLFVNLDMDKYLSPVPEPLLAPPAGFEWRVLWSSEDPRYGGGGALPIETSDSWFVPGKSAFFLKPETA
jgi:maltooligosyltrehalose trehalohydrolase